MYKYGGSIALIYSIVYDIYGPRNFKPALAICMYGFGAAVAIGGISSAYSFSGYYQIRLRTI